MDNVCDVCYGKGKNWDDDWSPDTGFLDRCWKCKGTGKKENIMSTKYNPRNDFVIIRAVKRDATPTGIGIPQNSAWGEEYIVEAIGPKVENLKIGDKVMMIGSEQNGTMSRIPMTKDLMVTREENVIYTWEEVPEIASN